MQNANNPSTPKEMGFSSSSSCTIVEEKEKKWKLHVIHLNCTLLLHHFAYQSKFRKWPLYLSVLVLEQTPKYWTSNTPNIDCPNIELSEHHILAQNRTLNMLNITKIRMVCEHQTVCSKTSLVTQQQDRTLNTSEHHILAQNRTSNMSNITKNRTVREHQTVSSKTIV